MTDYPTPTNFLNPLPAYPVKQMCRAIDGGKNTFEKIYGAVNIYYNYTGNATCFNLDDDSDPHGLGGWTWQACTEMILLTDGNKEDSIFPASNYSYNDRIEYCKYKYDIDPRPDWVPLEFGGHHIHRVLKRFGSNIIFFNGLRDPWSGGGRELPPRRDLERWVVGRRALEEGCCFSLMSATTNHRSEGVGSVSSEAPPMLKSGRMQERKREQNICCESKILQTRKDVSKLDSSSRRDIVLGKHSRPGIIPGTEERAQCSPRGFHTFYINQLEMGLRLPLPRFIAALCQHIKISPSQLERPLELIKEDLLCLCGFIRKGVELFGDLDERMEKAAMLKALEEAEEDSSGAAATPTKVVKKSKPSTPVEKEARRQRKKKGASTLEARPTPTTEKSRSSTPPIPTTEEHPDPMPVITIPKVSSPKRGPTKETGPGRAPALNFLEDSLVVSPFGAVATRFLCHIALGRDIGRLSGTSNLEALGLFSANLASAMAWGGEMIKLLTRAQREVNITRRSFDEAMGHHSELVAELEELEATRAQEKEALEAQIAAEKASRAAEQEALEVEKEALRSELDAALVKKSAIEVELEETKARAAEEVERLKGEATNAWDLGKEELLQSSEFDVLCAKKSLAYFKLASKAVWLNSKPTANPRRGPPSLPLPARGGSSAELGLSVHVEELREEKSYARRCQCGTGLKFMCSGVVATRGGAHHVDLRFSTSEDPEWLQHVRKREINIISKWISQYYHTLIN
ncbi:lysosomal Pro-X carboxypeptidase-like [Dorcoceras hygrometricum]|uniref:Lysosomal Pro-X carboxypeptidase-like n=1 Tax=Dorcoceras hygrometricum TaxID=472368 RepID=A0A2Z7CXY1_9LAMI|nr:lysosomal Pro-X carboxypeptidase-like [Dorcoceras hygrometricum]